MRVRLLGEGAAVEGVARAPYPAAVATIQFEHGPRAYSYADLARDKRAARDGACGALAVAANPRRRVTPPSGARRTRLRAPAGGRA
jgi:hypothetical protein